MAFTELFLPIKSGITVCGKTEEPKNQDTSKEIDGKTYSETEQNMFEKQEICHVTFYLTWIQPLHLLTNSFSLFIACFSNFTGKGNINSGLFPVFQTYFVQFHFMFFPSISLLVRMFLENKGDIRYILHNLHLSTLVFNQCWKFICQP